MSDRDVRYPPIADYGMLGDLRSAALLSKQGSIDWMCLPRFDSPWIFGRLLDWDKGGYLELRPVGGAVDYRQYRRDSNVIQTVWSSGHARVRVVDWMPVTPKSKRLKPPESLRLIRMVQPVAGATDWRLTFKPRFDYGRQVPALSLIRPGMLVELGLPLYLDPRHRRPGERAPSTRVRGRGGWLLALGPCGA